MNRVNQLYFLVFLLLLANGLTAQVVDKGNFMIGSTFGFSGANSQVESTANDATPVSYEITATQFSITPRIGYFLAQNFVLGINMDYTLSRVEEPDRASGDTAPQLRKKLDSDLLFGPFARYYIPIGDDKLFFGELSFGFGSSVDQGTVADGEPTTSTNVFSASVGPGFSIVSTDAIGIEALVKYNFARSSFDLEEAGGIMRSTTTRTNQIDLSIGLTFYFTRVAPAGTGRSTNDKPTSTNTNFY